MPDITRHTSLRRNSGFRESAVPLSPHRLLAISEVEGFDSGAALPTVVGRIGGLVEDVAAWRDVAPPCAGLWRRFDVHPLNGAWRFQAGYDTGNAAILPRSDNVERLVVIE